MRASRHAQPGHKGPTLATLHMVEAVLRNQQRKLNWWIARLKLDPFAGDQIPKARIPTSLARRSGLPGQLANAWRFELPLAFRGIYTVSGHPGSGVVVIILEILTHKESERLFGYR